MAPFISLANQLAESGIGVAICTHSSFCKEIDHPLIETFPCSDALLTLSDNTKDQGKLLAWMKSLLKAKKEAKQALFDFWDQALLASSSADLLLFHPKLLVAEEIMKHLDIQGAMIAFAPLLIPTSDFPHPCLPKLSLPGYNRFSYKLMTYLQALATNSWVNEWLQTKLNRKTKSSFKTLAHGLMGQRYPIIHAFSSHVVRCPNDWGPNAFIDRYWSEQKATKDAMPKMLIEFLDKGKKMGKQTLYVGFGSMRHKNAKSISEEIASTALDLGYRVVFASGWGGFGKDLSHADLFVTESIPHHIAFPYFDVIIHHGGAGTVAAACGAGAVQIICPFLGDQTFWAERTVQLGVAPTYIPINKLTRAKLRSALLQVQREKLTQQRADQLAKQLKKEANRQSPLSLLKKIFPKKFSKRVSSARKQTQRPPIEKTQ